MKSTKNRKADKGLGDTVEKIFKSVGVDKLAKWALGKDCGCQERKEVLNRIFPYNKPECLVEDEFNYLDNFFKSKGSKIDPEVQTKLVSIYNRVFKEKAQTTSCSSCFLNGVLSKLKQVYKEY